jgi:hypothetical protein
MGAVHPLPIADPPCGPVAPSATDDEVIGAAIAILADRLKRGIGDIDLEALREWLVLVLGDEEREFGGCAFFTNGGTCLQCDPRMFAGGVAFVSASPRVIVQRGLQLGATRAVRFHNHPGGPALPSDADRDSHADIRDALLLFEIVLHDDLIVAGQEVFSFRDAGILGERPRARKREETGTPWLARYGAAAHGLINTLLGGLEEFDLAGCSRARLAALSEQASSIQTTLNSARDAIRLLDAGESVGRSQLSFLEDALASDAAAHGDLAREARLQMEKRS